MGSFLNSLPRSVKIFLFFVILGLLFSGFLSQDLIQSLSSNSQLSPSPSPTIEYIKVDFIIISKDNQPLEQVQVQFIFDGAPAPRFTNTDGYVRIEIPKRDNVNVLLVKEGFEDINREINLTADPNDTIQFIMKRNRQSYNLKHPFLEGEVTYEKYETLANFHGYFSMGDETSAFRGESFSIYSQETQVINVENQEPIKFIEKISKDVTIDTDSQQQEDGLFHGESILYEKNNGIWYRSLIDTIPSPEQQERLNEDYSLTEYYPSYSINIGESWDMDIISTPISQSFTTLDKLQGNKVQGKLVKILQYAGEECALIEVVGTVTMKPNWNKLLFDQLQDDLEKELSESLEEGNESNDFSLPHPKFTVDVHPRNQQSNDLNFELKGQIFRSLASLTDIDYKFEVKGKAEIAFEILTQYEDSYDQPSTRLDGLAVLEMNAEIPGSQAK